VERIYATIKGRRMLLIVGTFRIAPNRLADAKPAMEAMITSSRAEAGCILYNYAEDILVSGLIHVKEAWASRAALGDHFASPHIAAWRSTWQSLGITDRNLMLYDVGEPQPT
jgi:quinol monooxygenase YgiN